METIEHKEPGTYYVDLDGTLAHYTGWKSPEDIGDPIPAMMDRVKAWLMDGKPVKIFTARFPEHHGYVREWLFRNGLGGIPVTNVKGIDACEFWDDLAVPVERNTGRNLIEALQSMRKGREEDMEVVKLYMEDAGQFRNTITALRKEIATLRAELLQQDIESKDKAFYQREFAAVSAERDALKAELEAAKADRDEARRQVEVVSVGSVRDKLESLSVYQTPDQIELRECASVPVKVRLNRPNPNLCIRQIMDCELTRGATREEVAEMILLAFEEHAVIDAPAGVPSEGGLYAISARAFSNALASGVGEIRAEYARNAAIRDAVLAGVAGEREISTGKAFQMEPVEPGTMTQDEALDVVRASADEVEALARVLCDAYCASNKDYGQEWDGLRARGRSHYMAEARAAIAHFQSAAKPVEPSKKCYSCGAPRHTHNPCTYCNPTKPNIHTLGNVGIDSNPTKESEVVNG